MGKCNAHTVSAPSGASPDHADSEPKLFDVRSNNSPFIGGCAMWPGVIKVKAQDDYKLILLFDNDERRSLDVK
jgi:hypothetical protein